MEKLRIKNHEFLNILTSVAETNLLHWDLFIRRFIIEQFRIFDGLKVDPKSVISKDICISYTEN